MQVSKVKQSGTFDFNNPPTDKYDYHEFPRMMYRGTQSKPANNAEEQEEALAHGWFLTKTEALEAADAGAPRTDEAFIGKGHPYDAEEASQDEEAAADEDAADAHPAHAVHHRTKKKKK